MRLNELRNICIDHTKSTSVVGWEVLLSPCGGQSLASVNTPLAGVASGLLDLDGFEEEGNLDKGKNKMRQGALHFSKMHFSC